MQIYEGGLKAKEKLDESNAGEITMSAADSFCRGALWAGDKVIIGAMTAGSAVNGQIDANPTLSDAKRKTTQKIGQAATFLSGLICWDS